MRRNLPIDFCLRNDIYHEILWTQWFTPLELSLKPSCRAIGTSLLNCKATKEAIPLLIYDHDWSARILIRLNYFVTLLLPWPENNVKSCYRFAVTASLEAGFTVQVPSYCPGNETKPCKGKSFRHMKEVQTLSDYQEIRLQQKGAEAVSKSGSHTIEVLLGDDLVDCCHPGGQIHPNQNCNGA